jgi:anti-anti-sigma factor
MDLAPAESDTTHVALSAPLVAELGDPRSTLRATTQRNGSVVVVIAGGDVDASNEDIWRQLLSEAAAIATPPGLFIVDVSGLGFMGCCAFAALADEAERCRGRDVPLRVVSCHASVRRIIDACNLSATLPLYPTADSALSQATA